MPISEDRSHFGYEINSSILYINSIEKPGARLPSIVSAFFARASLILLTPEDEMYCEICNFILLKPVMDLSQVGF